MIHSVFYEVLFMYWIFPFFVLVLFSAAVQTQIYLEYISLQIYLMHLVTSYFADAEWKYKI